MSEVTLETIKRLVRRAENLREDIAAIEDELNDEGAMIGVYAHDALRYARWLTHKLNKLNKLVMLERATLRGKREWGGG